MPIRRLPLPTVLVIGLAAAPMACSSLLGIHDFTEPTGDASMGPDGLADSTSPYEGGAPDGSDSGVGPDSGHAGDSGGITMEASAADAADAGDSASDATVAMCAASCTMPCESCVVPGQMGTCVALPNGVDDNASFCEGMALCNDAGQCVGAQGENPFGTACTQPSDCYNGVCAAGYCKLQNGDPCADNASCGSGLCSANLCTACGVASDCPSNVCNGGICALPGGYICGSNSDCASATCAALTHTCIQTGSEACTPAGCVTHFCGTTSMCQTCSTSTDCPLNSPCTGGSCLAPPGAYCTQNTDCASGVCAPAPLLGVPKCQ